MPARTTPIPTPSKRIAEYLRELPAPVNYFAGVSGLWSSSLHDVLVFHRATAQEALDGGVHMHPRFVLCMCLDTSAVMTVDGGMLPLARGQGLLLFPHQQHHYSSFERDDISWLYISFELTEREPLAVLRNNPFALSRRSWVYTGRVVEAYRAQIREDRVKAGGIVSWMTLLLGELLSNPGSYLGQPQLGKHEELNTRRQCVRETVSHIYEHLDRDLSIPDLAQRVHTSESNLRRVFREEMGMSLGRFMLQARINHAASLLRTTDLSVGEVALASGFSSLYAFSRSFKTQAGQPPTAFRKEGRKDDTPRPGRYRSASS